MGKSTISMAIFNSFLYVYQRVNPINPKNITHFSIWIHHRDLSETLFRISSFQPALIDLHRHLAWR